MSIQNLDSTDALFIIDLLNEPSFIENIGDKGVRTTEEALGYIQTAGTENYAKHGFGMFRVSVKDTERATERAIGICGLLQRDFLAYPDLGFAFLERYHNQGFGTEAADAITGWATRTLQIRRLAAFTSLTNVASIRVLEKVGFISQGEQDLPGKFGRCHVLEWQQKTI